jgi:hypothetical protein
VSKFGTFAACLVSVAGVAVMAAPPAVADSSFGDWVSAVCRPGTIFDSTGRMMRSAVESATCMSPQGRPIYIAIYSSKSVASARRM